MLGLFLLNICGQQPRATQLRNTTHIQQIEEKSPAAMLWVDENHPYVWSRGKLIEYCKVDYINNNLSESFNSWVSKQKDQQIVDLFDKIRRMIIQKFDLRRKIGEKM